MEETKQWHVIYTRVGQEQKMLDYLRRRKIESFYPVNRMVKTSYGRERLIVTPLIERYVFAHLLPAEANEVKNQTCVIGFVYWLFQPVVVEKNDIMLLKHFCETHVDVQLERTKVLSLEPAFISLQYSDHDTELVNLHFPVLGYNIMAKQNRAQIKVITINDYQAKPETSSNQYAETR